VKEDLDWIVMKALEKDRARRYETVNGLAADLKRHLNNEPVTAVAPTLVYQLTKFYQRNRRVAQVAGAFGALMLIATLFSAWQAVRARKAETRAVAEAATAQNVAEFFWKGLIKQLSPWNYTNRDVRLRDALDVAAGQVEDSLKDDPAAEATVRIAFGRADITLSELPLAETNLLRAVALRRARLGDFHELTAEALDGLSGVYEFQGRFAESERALNEVVRIRERVFGKHHPNTVTAASRATFFRVQHIPPDEASRQLENTLVELRRDVGPDSDIYRKVLNQWGWLLLAQDELDRALQIFDETHRMAVADHGAESVSALWSLGLMAVTRARQGRHDEAEATFRRITAIHERICGPDHVITRDGRITMVEAVFLPQVRFNEAAEILLETARAEHQQLQYLRPATKGAIRALTNGWRGAGDEPGFDAFQNHIEAFRETSVIPEP
jgi:tetratricopeptide (TPR) repeat protein